MKIYNILLAALLSIGSVKAQECDIPLRPIVTPSSNGMYFPQVESYLTNKLISIAGNTSTVGLDNSQFGIAVAYDVLDKQIVGGEPAKIIYNLNVSLFVVDLKGQKVYASYATEMKGIGNNETKALTNTFQKLNLNNKEVKNFIVKGKENIVEYYNKNYPAIIKKAQSLAAMKNFDAAMAVLFSIPECSVGYEKALEELKTVYQQFVDQHCNENLAQARAVWISSPNSEGAATASVYLSEIYPDAACYQEAKELAAEIRKQMGEEWQFAMRRWKDEVSLERQRINAMREIAIAYATSQPKEEITNIFWK